MLDISYPSVLIYGWYLQDFPSKSTVLNVTIVSLFQGYACPVLEQTGIKLLFLTGGLFYAAPLNTTKYPGTYTTSSEMVLKARNKAKY